MPAVAAGVCAQLQVEYADLEALLDRKHQELMGRFEELLGKGTSTTSVGTCVARAMSVASEAASLAEAFWPLDEIRGHERDGAAECRYAALSAGACW